MTHPSIRLGNEGARPGQTTEATGAMSRRTGAMDGIKGRLLCLLIGPLLLLSGCAKEQVEVEEGGVLDPDLYFHVDPAGGILFRGPGKANPYPFAVVHGGDTTFMEDKKGLIDHRYGRIFFVNSDHCISLSAEGGLRDLPALSVQYTNPGESLQIGPDSKLVQVSPGDEILFANRRVLGEPFGGFSSGSFKLPE